MFKNNPSYQHQVTLLDKYHIYTPVNLMDGTSLYRYIEAINQDIYNRSGATSETIEKVCDEIITRCNDNQFKTARTDIAALANSLKYRLKYPVDEHCAIRMGCILSYMEYEHEGVLQSEPEKQSEVFWMNKKQEIAFNNADAYRFFLTWGISNSPTYRELSDTLTDMNYFSNRSQQIASMLPSIKQ